MDIFEGSPRRKFFDIVFNANESVVEKELENLLIKFITLQKTLKNADLTPSNLDDETLQNELNDIFIQLSSNILSNSE